MTRVLFIPDVRTTLWLEYPDPPEILLKHLRNGTWEAPAPYRQVRAVCVSQADDFLVVVGIPASAIHRRLKVRGFSKRQLAVLAGMAEGLTSSQIALRLLVSTRAVDMQISRLKRKLSAANRAQTVIRAVELGLIPSTELGLREDSYWEES